MTSPTPELNEKDFIHEEYSKNPYPFWIWLCLLAIAAALFWGGKSWYENWMTGEVTASPFLQVSNRDFSLFLWQYPEHMRINSKQKSGYLPAFQYTDKINVEPSLADQYVEAPPELLFLYHTWKRLIGKVYFPRPIPVIQFSEFLAYDEQWQPSFWSQAPKEYVTMIASLSNGKIEDLQQLPQTALPLEVKQAFQGWQNFFNDKEKINLVKPTYGEMKHFLEKSPHFARNYWRNILLSDVPQYLQTLTFDKPEPTAVIPNSELAPFLKVAIYNFGASVPS